MARGAATNVRRLNVQIQPTRANSVDAEELIAHLCAAADGLVLEYRGENRGQDQVPYINLGFAAADHVAGWSRLRERLDNSEIGRAVAISTIVTCEGERGWDDYLLLHHFDPAEKLDHLG